VSVFQQIAAGLGSTPRASPWTAAGWRRAHGSLPRSLSSVCQLAFIARSQNTACCAPNCRHEDYASRMRWGRLARETLARAAPNPRFA